jgi:hypothetical protein
MTTPIITTTTTSSTILTQTTKKLLAQSPQRSLSNLLKAFPDDSFRSLSDSMRVLQVLVNANQRELAYDALAHVCRLTSRTGNTKDGKLAFDMLRSTSSSSSWGPLPSDLCHSKFFLAMHSGDKEEATRLIATENCLPDHLKALYNGLIHNQQKDSIKKLYETGGDSPIGCVNYAAWTQEQGDNGTNASQLWEMAFKKFPDSLAAANGAKKFNTTIQLAEQIQPGQDYEIDTRIGQALTKLGEQAFKEGLSVTAEGLYRSALTRLEPAGKILPAYTLELSWCLKKYSELLKQWANRENEAQKLMARSVELSTLALARTLVTSFMYDVPTWGGGGGTRDHGGVNGGVFQ